MAENDENDGREAYAAVEFKEAPEPGAYLKDPEPLTHTIDGATYPLLVANRTGHVGTLIRNPSTGQKMAVLTATFAWDKVQPFYDQLDVEARDERVAREDESIRKSKNMMTQNANLFDELVQSGVLASYNEEDELVREEALHREGMMKITPEMKSQIIEEWLDSWFVARHFRDKTPDLHALLTGTETSIFFMVRVGSTRDPVHVLLFEFNVPSEDARRTFQDNAGVASRKQQGEKVVTEYHVNYPSKARFAQKHFIGVKGIAVTDRLGVVEIDETDLRPVTDNNEDLELVRKGLAPHFWIQLADELAGAFDLTGK